MTSENNDTNKFCSANDLVVIRVFNDGCGIQFAKKELCEKTGELVYHRGQQIELWKYRESK